MIDFLLRAYRLKDEERAGWGMRGIARPESVADHSWGTALLCALHGGAAGVDSARAVRMALVHDLAEAETGDFAMLADSAARAVTREEKARRERAAIDRLAALGGPGAADVVALWEEYEAAATPEALFVRDMNLVDLVVQALLYERERRYDPAAAPRPSPRYERLDEFFATAGPRLSTDLGRRLYAQVRARYEGLRSA